MTLIDSFWVAMTALRANLLRSILTTLGIMIGVASVIIMMALGAGARDAVEEQIAKLGSNMLVVTAGSRRVRGRAGGSDTEQPLTESDLNALATKVYGTTAVSGQLDDAGPVIFGNANWTTTLSGVHPDYNLVRDWPVEEGRGFNAQDLRRRARVALLGQTVVKQLFGDADPIGATIRIRNVAVEVVGILSSKGSSTFGRDQDDLVLLPITTARGYLFGKSGNETSQVGRIYVKFAEGTDLVEGQEEIESLLRQRRRVRDSNDDSFSVRNFAEFMKARTEVFSTMTYLLGATSIVSLIVGGIGIMNIMLVSVTERTREIGLRIAVGARRIDILRQFLVEAVVLCLIGGIVGSAIGIAVTVGVANIAGWPALVSPFILTMALGAAAATGLIFGFFPAREAARLNPIEALRAE